MNQPHPRSTRPGRARRAAVAALVTAALAVAAAACSSGEGGALNAGGQATTSTTVPAGRLTVMTRNLYFGADLSAMFNASGAQLGPLATAAYQQMQANDAPARLVSVAREISSARPDLVALQEAVIWKDQATGQAQPTVIADFVSLLLADLAHDGTEYRVESTNNGFSGALPVSGVGLVSLQDRDVILARVDDPALTLTNPANGEFRDTLTLHVAGIAVPVVRGWASVDGRIDGRAFRLVGTHLEAYSDPTRDAQELQLLDMVSSSPLPVILAGDFNSPAAGQGSSAYQTALQRGLADTWAEVHPGQPGYTDGYSADLTGGSLTQRIDFVLTRGAFRATAATVVGTDPSEKTPSGRWPSDHAGVVVTLVVPAS